MGYEALLFLPGLLILSSFASSSETALFSLDRFQLRRMKDRHRPTFERIRTLLENPTRLLIVILLLNEMANLFIANLITSLVENLRPQLSEMAALLTITSDNQMVLILTFLSMAIGAPTTLFFGEITPKIIASKMNRVIAAINSRFLIYIYTALFPFLWLMDFFITSILKSFDSKGKSHLAKFINPLDEEDFVQLLEEAHREGTIEPSEKKLIQKVFQMDDSQCFDVMTPLHHVFMIEEKKLIEEVLNDIETQRYSRIPVYSKNKKNITGLLYLKDLLPLRSDSALAKKPISELMEETIFVSPTINLIALLRKFKKSKIHLAVVCEPQGPALGVVTLEDVLENLFGEIEDEGDLRDL